MNFPVWWKSCWISFNGSEDCSTATLPIPVMHVIVLVQSFAIFLGSYQFFSCFIVFDFFVFLAQTCAFRFLIQQREKEQGVVGTGCLTLLKALIKKNHVKQWTGWLTVFALVHTVDFNLFFLYKEFFFPWNRWQWNIKSTFHFSVIKINVRDKQKQHQWALMASSRTLTYWVWKKEVPTCFPLRPIISYLLEHRL